MKLGLGLKQGLRLESGLPFYIRIHTSTPSQGPARPGTGPSRALLPFTPTQPWRVTPTLTLTRATETQAQLHPQPRLGLVDSQANKVGQGCWSGLGLGPKCFLGLGFVQHSGRGQPLVPRQPSC